MAGGQRVTCTEIVSALYLLNRLAHVNQMLKVLLFRSLSGLVQFLNYFAYISIPMRQHAYHSFTAHCFKVKVMAEGQRVTCTEIVSDLYLLNPFSDSKKNSQICLPH